MAETSTDRPPAPDSHPDPDPDTGPRGEAARRVVHWPDLTADEAGEEWAALREWVRDLTVRYPRWTRLPECWWRHNDLIEALAALRDQERLSYAPANRGSGPMDWLRALHDTHVCIAVWIKRLPCTGAARGRGPHPDDDTTSTETAAPDGWSEFLNAAARRRAAQSRVLTGGDGPPPEPGTGTTADR